jgi:[acyl-carrier-protein] S-malonyltransferase
VTGKPVSAPSEIRAHLSDQVCAPVRWEDSMRWALAQGIKSFVEPGPGNVLGGIMRKIDKDADVRSVQEPADVRA